MWLAAAVGSALFAGLTAILAKLGVRNVDSDVATALRSVVILAFAWLMVFVTGSQGTIGQIGPRPMAFLVLSGLATGASWICYFRALSLADVNRVTPVVEEVAVESEEDEYSWITFEEDSEESASDIVEAVEETPVTEEIPEVGAISFDEEVMDAEESVFEAPEDIESFVSEEVSEEQVEATVEVSVMDEPVVEELDFEEPAMEIAEAPVETSEVEDIVEAEEVSAIEAVEEAAVEETEVCAPAEVPEIEEPTEATEVTEEVVIDAPVEPIAAMSLPGSIEVEPIAGIEVEGAQPSSDSAIADTVSVHEEVQAAVTSAEAESAPAATPRFNGLEEDGEGLPKLSDPVIRRPRTVRFRFSNGVLQNVESNEKSEPKEELRDPLA